MYPSGAPHTRTWAQLVLCDVARFFFLCKLAPHNQCFSTSPPPFDAPFRVCGPSSCIAFRLSTPCVAHFVVFILSCAYYEALQLTRKHTAHTQTRTIARAHTPGHCTNVGDTLSRPILFCSIFCLFASTQPDTHNRTFYEEDLWAHCSAVECVHYALCPFWEKGREKASAGFSLDGTRASWMWR